MLPCTAALFSSEVPASRLLVANLGTSERVIITEKRPLGSSVNWPRGLAPKKSIFLPSYSSVMETSVRVPTSSLGVVWLNAGVIDPVASPPRASSRCVFMVCFLCLDFVLVCPVDLRFQTCYALQIDLWGRSVSAEEKK